MFAARGSEYQPLISHDLDPPESANVVVGLPGTQPQSSVSVQPGVGPVILGRPINSAPSDKLSSAADIQKPPADPGEDFDAETPLVTHREMFAPPLLPVMLPGSSFYGGNISRSRHEGPEWVLAPGLVPAPGHGAVSAGLRHRPHGSLGLAIGALTGIVLGALTGVFIGGLALFGGLAGAGYLAAKTASRNRRTIWMTNELGELVRVKLWKAGKHVPLTEEGYWLVASDPRDSEMDIFVRRVLGQMRATATDEPALHRLVMRYSGSREISSLGAMREELRTAPWVLFS